MTPEDDVALVSRVLQGDRVAWKDMLERVGDIPERVPRWRKWGFSAEDQADATHDLILILRRALSGYRDGIPLRTFTYTVCVRRCIDMLRRKVRGDGLFIPMVVRAPDGRFVQQEFEDTSTHLVQAIIRDEMARMLREAVDTLDPACREAINEVYLNGASYEEFSTNHGVVVNTVGTRLHKCMKKLTALLKKMPSMREYFSDPNDLLQ